MSQWEFRASMTPGVYISDTIISNIIELKLKISGQQQVDHKPIYLLLFLTTSYQLCPTGILVVIKEPLWT